MNRITYEFNQEQVNMTLNYTNNPRQDTVINATGTIFNDIENLIMYLKVNVQEDKNDEDFRKPFFRTVVDIKKLLIGTYGNYIASTLMDGIKKSTDFELKFPFKKVNHFHAKLCNSNFGLFSGNIPLQELFNYWQIFSPHAHHHSFDWPEDEFKNCWTKTAFVLQSYRIICRN